MKKLLQLVLTSADKTWFWLAVLFTCIGLEAGALYFQEVLGYFPCELCIYTRVWLTGIALVSLLALGLKHMLWCVRVLLIVELILTAGLAHVTWRLLGLEYGWGPEGACSLVANFPSWARLDEWWPTLFLVQDSCAATPIVLFNLSMADGLAICSAGFCTAFLLSLWGHFRSPPVGVDRV